ncbi:MAG: hypothetical protein ABR977_08115 [Candidatus Dormibacteria bacterium]|jgi:hypothetical protein
METRKSKRSLRLALVMGAAVAGTALVGWGGLAAWQAYTQNNGNAFAVGSLAHSNVANGSTVTCYSTTSSAQAATTPCAVIVSGNIMSSSWTGATGTVAITNTGTLASNFSLSSPSAPVGSLCADLSLTVTGQDSPTPYVNQASIGSISPTPLNTGAGASNWATGATNTFTFAVAPATGFGSNDAVLGQTCTFNVLFTQSA